VKFHWEKEPGLRTFALVASFQKGYKSILSVSFWWSTASIEFGRGCYYDW